MGLLPVALAEAYGMTQDPKLGVPAQKALNYIVAGAGSSVGRLALRAQAGWRYLGRLLADYGVEEWNPLLPERARGRQQ